MSVLGPPRLGIIPSHDECRAYGAQDLDGHITLTFGQPGLRPCHSRRLQIFLLHEHPRRILSKTFEVQKVARDLLD